MAESIKNRLERVEHRIKEAALSCDRDPESVKLVAASKAVPVDLIRAGIKAGVTIVGENYVQEAKEKIEAIGRDNVSWHFIGHLQSNKAKYAVKLFDLIHTVDSLKLANELNKQAEKIGKVQSVLLQINTGMEASKSGLAAEDVMGLARHISGLKNLKVKGLMTIPPSFNAPEKVTPFFKELRHLRDKLRDEKIPGIQMDELSMGMTGDFEAAIREGSTFIRIGTAIFGKRQ